MRSMGNMWTIALILLLSVSAVGTAFAGEPPPDPPVPGEPELPPKHNGKSITLNFKDVELEIVLQHLSETAGLAIVTDEDLDGRITVVSRQPLDLDETIMLINSILKEKGYTAIMMGRILKIVTLDKAKEQHIPVMSGNDPDKIPATDRLITQVIPLVSIDAVKLVKDIEQFVPSYAGLSANASSNAIILTDTEANIKRIVQIVSALDTHKAQVAEVRVFPLKYADADSAAKLINDVFRSEDTSSSRRSSSSRSSSPFSRMFGRRDESSSDSDAFRPQQTIAAADERTNTVVVSGQPETLEVVAQVIKDLDSNPAQEQGVFIYRLKNAQASNLQEVLTKLFEETDASTAARRTSSGGSSFRSPFSRSSSSNQSASQGTGELVGQVGVVADEDTNSLLILAAPDNFDKIRDIIEQLDTPVPQVLIKVLIVEVTHGEDFDIGAEFSVSNLRRGGRGNIIGTDFGIAAKTLGFKYTLLDKDVTAAINLLEKNDKLDILSRPYILASDNRESTITIGQEVPFIRNTRTTETGQTINTIEYEDIGIILRVTPHINSDGLVIMDITPEISSITGNTVPISETVNAAVFAKRSAQTRVAIPDGQTIVIGGLMEDRKTENIKKVPILGSIPLIGALFRHTVTTQSKTELLIFITPHVVSDSDMLKAISDGEAKRSKLAPKAVAPGAFEEYIKGMQPAVPPITKEQDGAEKP